MAPTSADDPAAADDTDTDTGSGVARVAQSPSDLAGGQLDLRSGVLRIVVGVGLAVLSGVLAVLAAPSQGFGWLVLVAGVPMLVAQFHVLPARLAGLATFVTYGIAAWGTLAVLVGDTASLTAVFIGGSVIAAALAGGVAGQIERALWDRTGFRWWLLGAPLAWGVLCLVRLRLPFAGTDGFVSHALFRHPAVLQPVSVVGAVGLEIGLVAVHVALAALILGLLGHPNFPRARRRRIAAGLLAGVAIWVGWSWALLADPPASLRVAAVQPDPGGDDSWFSYSPAGDDATDPMLAGLVELSEEAAERGAQLVVWPEYGLMFGPCDEDEEEARQVIADLAERTGMYVVAAYGASDFPDGADTASGLPDQATLAAVRHRNEAVLITPDGECLGPYAKQHPVRWIDERSDTDYGVPVFTTELGRLAMIICYDMDFTDVTRTAAAGGAQFVAAPSDDWAEMARYHPAPLVFRAIENGVATAKADLAYDSAIIDPSGRIVAEEVDPDGLRTVVVADVPLGSGERTFWNRYAGLVEVIILAAAAVVGGLVLRDLATLLGLRRR